MILLHPHPVPLFHQSAVRSTVRSTVRSASRFLCRAMATPSASPRSYNDAVAALNSLQTNFSILEAIRKSGKKMNRQAIPEMIEWARRIGYKPSDFDKLNIIHVAGTKGKGSTCAFTSSILAQYRDTQSTSPISKIGMYTSPHLRAVRERIQVNGAPLSETLFTKYFFEVWDRMESSAITEGHDPTSKPVYFRFLTLVAFHTYIEEGVDTAVFEVGVGGEYDSTNIIEKPTVVGITSLGIDHVSVLGATIEEIAWHKAGVIKVLRPAFTVQQTPGALKVIEKRAEEKKAVLEVIGVHPEIAADRVRLGLPAEYQKANASLAAALAAKHLQTLGIDVEFAQDKPLPDLFELGLKNVVWPGRCQVKQEGSIEWCIDGAHTVESLEVAGRWFMGRVSKDDKRKRVLIFNQQVRDSTALIRSLANSLKQTLGDDSPIFDHAIFCTNVTWKEAGYKVDLMSHGSNSSAVTALTVQKVLATAWGEENPLTSKSTETHVLATIEDAVRTVKGMEGEVQVFVTGSLHLVGGVLEVLEPRSL